MQFTSTVNTLKVTNNSSLQEIIQKSREEIWLIMGSKINDNNVLSDSNTIKGSIQKVATTVSYNKIIERKKIRTVDQNEASKEYDDNSTFT